MTKVVDKYCIETQLKKKEFWTEHRASEKDSKKQLFVVVYNFKQLDSSKILNQKIVNDMTIVESIRSNCIIKRINYIKTPNNMYQIYEFLTEGSLKDLLKAKRYLPEMEALKVLIRTCECVSALHVNNTIHRNLRPSFFRFKKGQLYLTGLLNAVQLENPEMEINEILDGDARYAAPETASLQFSQKSDVFALGVIFHELLFGATPGPGPRSAFNLSQNPISPEAEVLLRRMLAPSPRDRPTVSEIQQSAFSVLKAAGGFFETEAQRERRELMSAFKNLMKALDFLNGLGDLLGEKCQMHETGVYFLYVVAKKINRIFSAFQNYISPENWTGNLGFQGDALDSDEHTKITAFIEQGERESVQTVIGIQSVLLTHVQPTLPKDLARDLEELHDGYWPSVREQVIQPFISRLIRSGGMQDALDKTMKFVEWAPTDPKVYFKTGQPSLP